MAKVGADDIWNRGILKKGFGICHGITGNAYAFISLYKHSQNPLDLKKAYQFGLLKKNTNILK